MKLRMEIDIFMLLFTTQGCQERHDPFKNQTIPEWSAVRSLDYGYSRMQIMNSSHLYWEQVSDDKVRNKLIQYIVVFFY